LQHAGLGDQGNPIDRPARVVQAADSTQHERELLVGDVMDVGPGVVVHALIVLPEIRGLSRVHFFLLGV
jgi:hypothetical protein